MEITDILRSTFERLGKLMKQISTAGQGWDGTYNGNPALATDYWFTLN